MVILAFKELIDEIHWLYGLLPQALTISQGIPNCMWCAHGLLIYIIAVSYIGKVYVSMIIVIFWHMLTIICSNNKMR